MKAVTTVRAMRNRMRMVSYRVGGVGPVPGAYSRCETLSDRGERLTQTRGAYGIVMVPRVHPVPWVEVADDDALPGDVLSIDPASLRPGDLIVDDAGNSFAEVLATVIDPVTGVVWVSPVPCASMTSLDIEFEPGLSVDVLLPRPTA